MQPASPETCLYWKEPGTSTSNLPTTHGFVWTKDKVSFSAHDGAGTSLAAWSIGSDSATIPSGEEPLVHINLWLFGGTAPLSGGGDIIEVRLRSFHFTPAAMEGGEEEAGGLHDAASPWVGGYVVSDGTSITAGVDAQGRVVSNVSSFSVDQECICSCSPFGTDGEATCLGANDGNAFSALAWRRADGTWWMEQSSLGTTPLYKVPLNVPMIYSTMPPAIPCTAVARDCASALTLLHSPATPLAGHFFVRYYTRW